MLIEFMFFSQNKRTTVLREASAPVASLTNRFNHIKDLNPGQNDYKLLEHKWAGATKS